MKYGAQVPEEVRVSLVVRMQQEPPPRPPEPERVQEGEKEGGGRAPEPLRKGETEGGGRRPASPPVRREGD